MINLIQSTDESHYAKYREAVFAKIGIDGQAEDTLEKIASNLIKLQEANHLETKSLKQNFEEVARMEERKYKDMESEIMKAHEREAEDLRFQIGKLEDQIKEANDHKKKR